MKLVLSLSLSLLPFLSHAFTSSTTNGHKGLTFKSKFGTSVKILPEVDIMTSFLGDVSSQLLTSDASAVTEPTYSKASYYTTLGLYLMSFPGIWSTIKRSTKAKTKRWVCYLL